jgi:hypothetical protein
MKNDLLSWLDSINDHDDYFCYSRAMKMFRDRYDAYLDSEAGENATLLDKLFKARIREGMAKITDACF